MSSPLGTYPYMLQTSAFRGQTVGRAKGRQIDGPLCMLLMSATQRRAMSALSTARIVLGLLLAPSQQRAVKRRSIHRTLDLSKSHTLQCTLSNALCQSGSLPWATGGPGKIDKGKLATIVSIDSYLPSQKKLFWFKQSTPKK